MKNENFNFIVNSLDDKALYQEICKKIKDTDAISFKLLGLVPLVSGLGVLVIWSLVEKMSPWILLLTGLFGALITFFIFHWELKNLQISDTFRRYAEILEAKKVQLENENIPSDSAMAGPFTLLRSKDKPQLLSLKNLKGWDKKKAEIAIYGTTIVFWLLLSLLVLLNSNGLM